VTLAVDALLSQGEILKDVVVLHTDSTQPVIGDALRAVRDEFASYAPYGGQSLTLQPLRLGATAVHDITTQAAAHAVLRALYQTVTSIKESGKRVHLCPAGGRKAMAMYAMLVAQLLFDETDRLWMLLSVGSLQQERRLHAAPGESSLLRIPVLPWRLSLIEKQSFLTTVLTPTEGEVLELAARYGLTDREIASRRYTSPKTVAHQLSDIYGKLRDFLGYRDDVRVDRHTLAAEFSAYFDVVDALGHYSPKSSSDK
jgi:CRISPR-associated Csx14 family protein